MIFTQGAPADKLYVLISGTVEIRFKPHDGEQLTVTVVQNEGVFGWSSALGRSTYTSCAVSTSDCEALSIEGRTLRELCDRHPQTGIIILERLAEVIAERLRNTHAQIVELLKESMRP